MTIEPEILEQLNRLAITGPPEEALRKFRFLQKRFPDDLNLLANAGGILIDIGTQLSDANLIREGIEACQDALGFPNEVCSGPHQLYNLGNGYSELFSIRRRQPGFVYQPADPDLQQAKTNYRTALQHESALPRELNRQLWVNYGNCLSALGRSFEAMNAYHQALTIDPAFSMALGNKAIEMVYLANITGKHISHTLIEAYQLLQQALADSKLVEHGGPRAREYFEAQARSIEQRFGDKAILQTPLRLTSPKAEPKEEFHRFYQEYCWNNRLYINLWLHDEPSKISLEDSISLSIVTPVGDTETFSRLASYLNQIKEDYATARVLLVESQYPRQYGARISQATKFIDTLDYSKWGIPTSLLKASFAISINVLDKIAFFINDYLDLKIRPRDVKFKSERLWLQKKSKRTSGSHDKEPRKTLRPEILETNNYSLFALYDVYIDSKSQPLKQLWDIRNALTHRYLVVHELMLPVPPLKEAHHHIDYAKFLQQTLAALQLVRAAILYLTSFVDIQERRKLAQTDEPTMPLYYRSL